MYTPDGARKVDDAVDMRVTYQSNVTFGWEEMHFEYKALFPRWSYNAVES